MKKKSFFVIVIAILFIVIGFGISRNIAVVSATTVGQQLLTPETGWTKYDDADSMITYTKVDRTAASADGTTSSAVGLAFKFEFYGTKLRVLGHGYSQGTITIDGKDYSITSNGIYNYDLIIFEKLDLELETHTVSFKTTGTAWVTAFQIDDTGHLVDSSAVATTDISLDKTSLDMKVGEQNKLTAKVTPDNATKKDITWTSSDESVATVDSQGNITSKKEGQAIITATTTDGSNLSAKCTVVVAQPGRAILRITMVNNERKEFDISSDEISKFVEWYNKNSNPSYSITETSNIKPFSSRTDYIAHDKISSFEVNQYTNN